MAVVSSDLIETWKLRRARIGNMHCAARQVLGVNTSSIWTCKEPTSGHLGVDSYVSVETYCAKKKRDHHAQNVFGAGRIDAKLQCEEVGWQMHFEAARAVCGGTRSSYEEKKDR